MSASFQPGGRAADANLGTDSRIEIRMRSLASFRRLSEEWHAIINSSVGFRDYEFAAKITLYCPENRPIVKLKFVQLKIMQ